MYTYFLRALGAQTFVFLCGYFFYRREIHGEKTSLRYTEVKVIEILDNSLDKLSSGHDMTFYLG